FSARAHRRARRRPRLGAAPLGGTTVFVAARAAPAPHRSEDLVRSPHADPARRRRGARRVAAVAALVFPGLLLTGLTRTADAADAPTADPDAVVIYQVERAGVAPTALAQTLLAQGFDVS